MKNKKSNYRLDDNSLFLYVFGFSIFGIILLNFDNQSGISLLVIAALIGALAEVLK